MSPYKIAQTHLPSGWPEDGVRRLAEAIEAYGRERLEEAAAVCERDADNQQAFGHHARAAEATRLAVVIRGLIDQPPPPARGESTG